MRYGTRWARRNRALGLCSQCNARAEEGRSKCLEHARSAALRIMARRRAAGQRARQPGEPGRKSRYLTEAT